MSMLIELNNAGLFAGGNWRARHISFAVDADQIVTLIGPNGAGKSTSVKMALGIEKPTESLSTQTQLERGLCTTKVSD